MPDLAAITLINQGDNSSPHDAQNLDFGRNWPSSNFIPQLSQKGRNESVCAAGDARVIITPESEGQTADLFLIWDVHLKLHIADRRSFVAPFFLFEPSSSRNAVDC